jgi:sugar lactone lactonase YvrE
MGWNISDVAGTGTQGHAGDGGPAAAALLNNPFDIAFTADGDMVFSDTFNHCIRRVGAKTGIIRNVAGTGERGFGGDGGPATEALLNEPYGVVVDRGGRIFFADRLNGRVRQIDAAGRIATLAHAGLVEPNGLALDASQTHLYIADVADHRVRVVDLATGALSTFAGTGEAKHSGDGGPAVKAGIFGARAVAFAPDGSLYAMERQGSSIRRIWDGTIETVAGTPGQRGYAGDGDDARRAVFAAPKEMAVDADGNIYVVDTENHAIRRIDALTRIVETIAGPATGAGLARPHGAAVGPDGAIYIGDSETHRVRKLTRV